MTPLQYLFCRNIKIPIIPNRTMAFKLVIFDRKLLSKGKDILGKRDEGV
ncbi:hypothetical protein XSR1_120037 [Xenorhabdus szentirmaii DSM 16338]|uniref:Uncharacterized protein n=1 Tax=Xenorhabdus szentirmaii DSM 16338 TaxID=1427518 RepID=W1IUK8_9GAMM|nr:hypothetical protein XSR1_120037 [Xenorhabdus szentirmaii DSM 16338]